MPRRVLIVTTAELLLRLSGRGLAVTAAILVGRTMTLPPARTAMTMLSAALLAIRRAA